MQQKVDEITHGKIEHNKKALSHIEKGPLYVESYQCNLSGSCVVHVNILLRERD